MMKLQNTKIVSLNCSDGLMLKGIFVGHPENDTIIIHIHGKCGNFYENDFIPVMCEMYSRAKLNFLAFSNRGHDCISEAYQYGKLTYIGGSVENFNDCVLDIEAAIEYSKRIGITRIILQGHSFGCDKVVNYLHKKNKNLEFILLSPADSCRLLINYIKPKTFEKYRAQIKYKYKEDLNTLVSENEYGIRGKGLQYHIPITAKALLSWIDSPAFKIFRFEDPLYNFLGSRGCVCIGEADKLQTESIKTVMSYFEKRISQPNFIFEKDGDHHFHSFERSVIKKIIDWIRVGNNTKSD